MKTLVKRIILLINLLVITGTILSLLSQYISPESVWLVAFFGLIFPLFIILNFIFLLFWAYHFKYYFLFSFFIIVLSWNSLSRIMQLAGPKKTNSDTSFSVVSYNSHIFNRFEKGKYRYTYDTIIPKLQQINPDILCLQEYRIVKSSQNYSENQVDNSFNFAPHHHTSFNNQDKNNKIGLAIFSKFPMINKGEINLNTETNGCIYADVIIQGDTTRIYNAHLQSIRLKKNGYSVLELDSLITINPKRIGEMKDISYRLRKAYKTRAKQVDVISEHIRNSPYPVILCGDFNDTPISYSYHKLSHKLKDSFIEAGKGLGTTYLGEFPSVKIDYIFYSKSYKAISYSHIDFRVSDHLPIKAVLSLRD